MPPPESHAEVCLSMSTQQNSVHKLTKVDKHGLRPYKDQKTIFSGGSPQDILTFGTSSITACFVLPPNACRG